MFEQTDFIFCHKNCFDGSTAAVLLKQYCQHVSGHTPSIVEYWHEQDETKYQFPNITDKHVVVVDFAFTRNVLLELKKRCASLYVIDHHKSAQDELKDLEFCTFDMSRSAAQLVWDMVYGGNRPFWVDCVGNRDLWNFQTGDDTDCFMTNLHFRTTYQSHLKVIEEISNYNLRQLHRCLELGRHQKQFQNCLEHKSIQAAKKCRFIVPDTKETYTVYVSDDYENRSNVGSALSAKDDCDFAVIYKYDISRGVWNISLRGKSDKKSCLEIATQFGGGGHRNACGITWTGRLEDILTIIH